MHRIVLRFLKREEIYLLKGEFEIFKLPNDPIIIRSLDGQERNLRTSDRITFNIGLNEMIYRTWNGEETVLAEQKEFSVGNFVGSFFLTEHHQDLNTILVPSPCQAFSSDYDALA